MNNLFNKIGERLNRVSSLKLTLLAVLSALIVGAFIIIVSDVDNLKNGDILGAISTVGSAYWALVVGSFGSLRAISNTINSSTPLILCGVSVAVAFKAGLFNIGATGQMSGRWRDIRSHSWNFESAHGCSRGNHHHHVEQHGGVFHSVATEDQSFPT